MDSSKRFDQLESLLVDLARKQDQLSDAIARQEVRFDNIGDQLGDIINILKLSAARHTETEQQQAAALTELKQQSQRQDVAVEALKVLLT